MVRGEAEKVIPDLADYLREDKALAEVPSITYMDEGEIRATPQADLLKEDELPESSYHGADQSHVMIEAGRGCPFNCEYCYNSEFWGGVFRMKPPEKLVDEITSLEEETGIDRYILVHDLFTADSQKLEKFCELIEGTDVSWVASTRADTVNEEDLDMMNEAGCELVWLGVETGDQRTQERINKDLDLEKVDRLVSYVAEKEGMEVKTSFIVGFPHEDMTSIDRTLQKVTKYRADLDIAEVALVPARPLRGSDLYREYRDRLSFRSEIYRKDYSSVVLDTEKEVSLIRRYPEIFSHYYFPDNPNYNPYYIHVLPLVFGLFVENFPGAMAEVADSDHRLVDFVEEVMGWEDRFISPEEYREARDRKKVLGNLASYIRYADPEIREVFREESISMFRD